MKLTKKLLLHSWTLIPFLVLVLAFELFPLLYILLNSVSGADGLTLEHFHAVFTKPQFISAIKNSISISAVSALIGLAIASFAAQAAVSAKGRLRHVFTAILNMTSNFSGVPLAFSYIVLLGNVGVLVLMGQELGIEALANFNLYSRSGLSLLYIYFQVPLATLLVIPSFQGIRREWKEAAFLMRATPVQFWIYVGLPVLAPSLLGTLSVLFSNALAAYATAYALLINNYPLLSIKISEMFVGDIFIQKELGSALSVTMIFVMTVCVILNNSLIKIGKRKEAMAKK